MKSKFTQMAQNTLGNALAFARDLGHTYIGSEHLLLGLLSVGDSSASRFLYERGIDAGIAMLYFGLIVDTTMFDSKWSVENIDKDYKIPSDYEVVGYCNI